LDSEKVQTNRQIPIGKINEQRNGAEGLIHTREDHALNIISFFTFVKPFIFTCIQRLKTGLFYKRNSVIFIDGCMSVGRIFPEGGQ